MDDHTVRVREETLAQLKEYKEKWDLSYDALIDMALKNLKGADLTPFLVEAPAYRIKISLNRTRINDNVKKLLKNGYDLFIPDVTHRQAMYINRTLKKLGFDCVFIKSECDGSNGFLFTMRENSSENTVRVNENTLATLKVPQPKTNMAAY